MQFVCVTQGQRVIDHEVLHIDDPKLKMRGPNEGVQNVWSGRQALHRQRLTFNRRRSMVQQPETDSRCSGEWSPAVRCLS